MIGLALLAVFAVPTLVASASTGQAERPTWTDCRGAHPHGNIDVGAALGQNVAVVDWNSPPSDWISDLGCKPYPFTHSEMTIYVSSPGINPVPNTVNCFSTTCADTFAILQTKYFCVGSRCVGETVPYNLRFNDKVVVEVTTEYAGFENHYGSYTLIVTS